MQIYEDIEQGTDEWRKVRSGIPTASEFACLIMKGRDGGESKTRASYLRRLAAEVVTGEPLESFTNGAMERGKVMEAEARDYYAMRRDLDPKRVGFIRSDNKGCSPDSLLGRDGMLEIKTQRGDLLIDTIFKGEFPSEHVAQTQGSLWVAEREWIDLLVYWPRMPVFIKRAYRDEAYIARLRAAVDAFSAELHETVEKIRAWGK